MAWIPLSVQDILNSLTEQEQAGTSSDSAQSDLTVIVSSVTGLIRGRIRASNLSQTLGPEGTIPEELYAAAISIARFKYLTHLPGTQLITVDRRADKDEAYEQLEAVAVDGIILEPPVGAILIETADYGQMGPTLQGPEWLKNPGWPFWDGYW